jgi:hypothetical protein
MRFAAALLTCLLLPLALAAQATAADGPRFFAPDSVWNAPLPAADVKDPLSSQYVYGLRSQVRNYGVGFATSSWSVPIVTVPWDQPRVRVTIDNGNVDLQAAFASVPIPADAIPAGGTDGHLVVWQPAKNTMWEMFRARRLSDGWHARYGGRIADVASSPGFYRHLLDFDGVLERPWWGATATSLPLGGGLITLQDLARGSIDHAIAMAVPRVKRGVRAWPAQRSDGRYYDTTALPEGTRFRLDPALNVDALNAPEIVKMVARAAQRYGMIVRDGGGAVAVYGEDPTRSGSTAWDRAFKGLRPYQVMKSFPWGKLRVTPLVLTPDAG